MRLVHYLIYENVITTESAFYLISLNTPKKIRHTTNHRCQYYFYEKCIEYYSTGTIDKFTK